MVHNVLCLVLSTSCWVVHNRVEYALNLDVFMMKASSNCERETCPLCSKFIYKQSTCCCLLYAW